MKPAVLLLGTFDTKGAEYAFVRAALQRRGHDVLTMDLGVLEGNPPPGFPVDIPASRVAEAGGASLDELQRRRDRGSAVQAMQEGARVLIRALWEERRFAGVLRSRGRVASLAPFFRSAVDVHRTTRTSDSE